MNWNSVVKGSLLNPLKHAGKLTSVMSLWLVRLSTMDTARNELWKCGNAHWCLLLRNGTYLNSYHEKTLLLKLQPLLYVSYDSQSSSTSWNLGCHKLLVQKNYYQVPKRRKQSTNYRLAIVNVLLERDELWGWHSDDTFGDKQHLKIAFNQDRSDIRQCTTFDK